MNTEESFVLASLKEFVKLWGSGTQASFNLECRNGQAWFKLSSLLGPPNHPHFTPPHVPRGDHGVHGYEDQHPPKRKRGPKQILRNRARAEAHRASIRTSGADDSAVTADLEAQPAATAEESTDHLPPAPPSTTSTTHPAATAGLSSSTMAPPPPPPAKTAATAAPTVDLAVGQPQAATFKEVSDEILSEQIDVVTVRATAVFENCPDENLTEDYFGSLQKFLASEDHLKRNILSVNVKTSNLASRESGNGMFTHTLLVDMAVSTNNLWEPAQDYVAKHLAKSDWLRGNKTRITLNRIHRL